MKVSSRSIPAALASTVFAILLMGGAPGAVAQEPVAPSTTVVTNEPTLADAPAGGETEVAAPAPLVAPNRVEPKYDGIDRHGFTLQLALGGGTATYIPDAGDSQTYGGLGFNVQLGGFFNPCFALTLKITTMNWGLFRSDEVDLGYAGFAGPSFQVWLGDNFALEGGVGLGMSTVAADGTVSISDPLADDEVNTEYGLGVAVALNYFLWANEHHALGLQAGFQPSFLENGPVLNGNLAFVWQYY